MSIAAKALNAPSKAARLAGGDLRCAIGGERPVLRDWRGKTCTILLARLAGTDLRVSAIRLERPALRDWRGKTCAARLAGRHLRGAIDRERPALCCRHDRRGQTCSSVRHDWRGETCAARLAGRDLRGAIGGERVQETCAAQLAASDLRGERPDGRRATSLSDLCRALRAMGCKRPSADVSLFPVLVHDLSPQLDSHANN